MCTLAETPSCLANCRHLLVSHLNQSACSPTPALGDRLRVCGEVERDEEYEVRAEDANSSDGSELLAGALARIREPGPVGRCEVSPGGEVDKSKVKNELDDLHDGDIFLPPDADSPRTLEVVPVHDNVDHKIQSYRDPRNRGVANELGVAEKGRCAMVIGMEESQRLLLQE